MPKAVHLSWNYFNELGGVPERDDVRFHVAIREADTPIGSGAATLADFPTIEQTKGIGATKISGETYTDGQILIVKDISFAGHVRWTDPTPTSTARLYRVAFPAERNKRYLIRLVAKRFCFDQSREKYSPIDHVVSVDVH